MAEMTKAMNAAWGVCAYGLGCGLISFAAVAMMAGECLMLAGDAAKQRALRTSDGGKDA